MKLASANNRHVGLEKTSPSDRVGALEKGKGCLGDGRVKHEGQDEHGHDHSSSWRGSVVVGVLELAFGRRPRPLCLSWVRAFDETTVRHPECEKERDESRRNEKASQSFCRKERPEPEHWRRHRNR